MLGARRLRPLGLGAVLAITIALIASPVMAYQSTGGVSSGNIGGYWYWTL